MGNFDAAIAATRRAVILDPLSDISRADLGVVLYLTRQHGEAAAAFAEVVSLNPDYGAGYAERGFALLELGDVAGARAACESKPGFWLGEQCLAVVYDKLGRHADAQSELAKIKAENGDAAAYQYATIYAQWGDRAKALEWLDTAMRLRDPGLFALKTDPLMDPLRREPRFQAICES
jgi:tetratricopeptide (TPR) repeat protein